MANREKIIAIIQGVVGGAILAAIVGFSAGWVVTTGTRDADVRNAWVNSQAEVCSTLVLSQRLAAGDVESLSGYKAREERTNLATANATILTGFTLADPDVVRACAKLLDRNAI